MNEADEDLFTAIRTAYTADTGSGGLNSQNTPSENPAYVRQLFDNSDPDYDRNNLGWPQVRVTINQNNNDNFGVGVYDMLIQFDIMVDRDAIDRTYTVRQKHDAVASRLRALFHRQDVTDSSDWKFGTMRFLRKFVGPTTGKVQTMVIQAAVAASTVSGT